MWIRDQLHGCVVNDHFFEFDSRVELCHLFAASQEQTIAKLHDVGFVDGSHLLPVVLDGVVEREFGNSQRLGLSDHFQTLDDSGHGLVLEGRVFSLGLFTNDDSVDILMASVDSRQAGNVDNVGVQVELIAQLHVECLELSSAAEIRSRQDSLEADFVLADGSDHILEWRAQRRVDL